MAESFDTSADNVGLHLENAYAQGELDEDAATEDSSVVQTERGAAACAGPSSTTASMPSSLWATASTRRAAGGSPRSHGYRVHDEQ